jgi:hypothetical protein
VASRKRNRCEGRDHSGRGQRMWNSGCSFGTFVVTVNVNMGQYQESLSCNMALVPRGKSHSRPLGIIARTQFSLSLHFSKLGREVSF